MPQQSPGFPVIVPAKPRYFAYLTNILLILTYSQPVKNFWGLLDFIVNSYWLTYYITN